MTLVRMLKNLQKRHADTIITKPLENWLMQHPDGVFAQTTEEAQRLIELLVVGGAGEVNSHREGRFGASGRGTCKRRQVFGFLGMPVGMYRDPILQNVFDDGTMRHVRWQMMLMKAGIVTHVESKYTLKKYRLGISLDAEHRDDEWFLELKGARRIPDDIPTPHILQMHTYFLVTGYEKGVYLVESKATNDWKEWIVHRDETLINKVKRELNALNEAVTTQTLPEPLDECRAGTGQYRTCPYAAHCLAHEAAGDPWPDHGTWEGEERPVVRAGRGVRLTRHAPGSAGHDGRAAG